MLNTDVSISNPDMQPSRCAAIRFAIGECSLGSLLVALSERGVCAIALADNPKSLVRDLQDRFPQAEPVGADPDFERLIAKVAAFIEAPALGLNLPLDVHGTAFQQRVWQALRDIPAGTTISYAEIARRIGSPKAIRAVAGACAANILAVAIPCHRVVRTDGSLSGYRWGIERKAELLRREKTAVMDPAVLTCSLDLPVHYRAGDILAFHRRDALAIAESVDDHSLRKGLVWNNQAACLTIRFNQNSADAELAIDGSANANDADIFYGMVRRMLGLNQHVEDFEQIYRHHPQIGLLIAQQPGLRVATTATVFEALSWAITAQQISLKAAISIRRKLIQTTGLQHSSGLLCYPDANLLAKVSESDLRQIGFSNNKAQTLLTVSRMIEDGEIRLKNEANTEDIEEISRQLLQIRGIGPWTVNYALLRGFGWLDGSLHGDIAVRGGLQTLLGSEDKIAEKQAQQWLSQFSPWRALVAAHLWAFFIRHA